MEPTEESFLPARSQAGRAAGYAGMVRPPAGAHRGAGRARIHARPRDGQLHLHPARATIPVDTQEFAINASNARWGAGQALRRRDAARREGPDSARTSTCAGWPRWSQTCIASSRRGGVFMYPMDEQDRSKGGKLRLMYEANPMAMLVEQAGGAAPPGARILDVMPDRLHQRVPVILGSKNGSSASRATTRGLSRCAPGVHDTLVPGLRFLALALAFAGWRAGAGAPGGAPAGARRVRPLLESATCACCAQEAPTARGAGRPLGDDPAGASRGGGPARHRGLLAAGAPIAATRAQLVLEVEPGPRTEIAQVELQFVGEIATRPGGSEYLDLLRAGWSLPVGAPFSQGGWDGAKQALLDAVAARRLRRGAHRGQPRRDRPERVPRCGCASTADRASLGELDVGPGASADRSRRALQPAQSPVRPTTARSCLLSDRTAEHPCFGSVIRRHRARPDAVRSGAGAGQGHRSTAALCRGGGGYSTNTGARVEFQHRDANLRKRGWEFSSGLRIEERRQALFADVFLPPRLARPRQLRRALRGQRPQKGSRSTRRRSAPRHHAARRHRDPARAAPAAREHRTGRRALALDQHPGAPTGPGRSARSTTFSRPTSGYVLRVPGRRRQQDAILRPGLPAFLPRVAPPAGARHRRVHPARRGWRDPGRQPRGRAAGFPLPHRRRAVGARLRLSEPGREGGRRDRRRPLPDDRERRVRALVPAAVGRGRLRRCGDAADTRADYDLASATASARAGAARRARAIDLAWGHQERSLRLHFGVAVAF